LRLGPIHGPASFERDDGTEAELMFAYSPNVSKAFRWRVQRVFHERTKPAHGLMRYEDIEIALANLRSAQRRLADRACLLGDVAHHRRLQLCVEPDEKALMG
jgi:hypothetical protein